MPSYEKKKLEDSLNSETKTNIALEILVPKIKVKLCPYTLVNSRDTLIHAVEIVYIGYEQNIIKREIFDSQKAGT